jgi:hypothetical protein
MPNFPAVSRQHWQLLKALDSLHQSTGGWSDEKEREAFQLLAAAVLYLDNSLPHLGSLHKLWRPPPPSAQVGVCFTDDDSPVSLFSRPNETIGQMHLASAAIRLPVALQKTIEAHAGTETVFGDLWGTPPDNQTKRADWRRPSMSHKFRKVKTLDHCAKGPLGQTEEERLQHSMTIITVIRDDFGHGEEGDSGSGGPTRATGKLLWTRYTLVVSLRPSSRLSLGLFGS